MTTKNLNFVATFDTSCDFSTKSDVFKIYLNIFYNNRSKIYLVMYKDTHQKLINDEIAEFEKRTASLEYQLNFMKENIRLKFKVIDVLYSCSRYAK